MSGRPGRSSGSSSSSPTRPSRPLLPIHTAGATTPSSLTVPQRTPSTSSLLYMPPVIYTPPPPPLHLTVRFNAALPDVHLDIVNPHQTTVVALKQLIRSRLAAEAEASSDDDSDSDSGRGAGDKSSDPLISTASQPGAKPRERKSQATSPAAAAARARLRFIHGGKILPDGAVLSGVLRAPPPPPPPSAVSPGGGSSDRKGKGVEGRSAQPPQRVYVNCSIGDELDAALLAAEEAAAAAPVPLHPPVPSPSSSTPFLSPFGHGSQQPQDGGGGLLSPLPRPASSAGGGGGGGRTPRGFDRLLAGGMPAVEVNHLRLQFRAIQAQRFTPDTMPSPDALTRMEDEWIDNDAGGTTTNPAATSLLYANGVNNSNNPATNNNGGGGDDGDTAAAAPATTTDDAYGLSAVSDQLLKGMVVGFFFPLGAAMWLQREDGLWSRRWAVFVWLGVLLSVSVGIVRALSAGDA